MNHNNKLIMKMIYEFHAYIIYIKIYFSNYKTTLIKNHCIERLAHQIIRKVPGMKNNHLSPSQSSLMYDSYQLPISDTQLVIYISINVLKGTLLKYHVSSSLS